jgi:hypothetical protein
MESIQIDIGSLINKVKHNNQELKNIQNIQKKMTDMLYVIIDVLHKKFDKLYIADKKELITTTKSWINSFKNNKNTGNPVEISVGLSILVMAGLEDINSINNDNLIEINSNILLKRKILGIYNLTQDDNISGTADIGIAYEDCFEYFSVTQWYGSLCKCIHNSSGNGIYNMKKHKIETDKLNKNAYKNAIEYRKQNFGNIPNEKWKRLSKKNQCKSTKNIMTYIAQMASNEWNLLQNDKKLERLKKILDLSEKIKCNCSGIIYFNVKTNKIHCIYKWSLKIDLNKCLNCTNDGIYIKHYIDDNVDNWIIKTQVKYNNGIIEGLNIKSSWKPKIANPISSWNCVASLEKIFNMTEITIL